MIAHNYKSLIRYVVTTVIIFWTVQSHAATEFYHDVDSTKTLQNIGETIFIPFEGYVNNGIQNGVYWIKINPQNRESILEIPSSHFRSIICYISGSQISPLKGSLYTAYLIPAGEICFVKIDCEKEAYIPIEVHDPSLFPRTDRNRMLKTGLYYGFTLMVIIFNLFYFFTFQDRSFLFYGFFLVGICLVISHDEGLFHYFSTDQWTRLKLPALLHPFGSLAGVFFATNYLQHEIHIPKFKYVILPLCFTMCICYVLYITNGGLIWYAVGDLHSFAILFLLWGSGVWLARKNAFSKFFAIAYSLVLFLGMDHFLSPMWGITEPLVSSDLLKIGSGIEMLVLSFAVFYRMRILQKQNSEMSTALYHHTSQITELAEELEKLKSGEENTISHVDLTEREIEILTRISEGKINKEIADELFISVNTVKYHTKKLYDKLDINSREEAKAKAADIQSIKWG